VGSERNENKVGDEAPDISQENYVPQTETMCAMKQLESNLV
jgi:hypothetical protein